MQSTISLNGTVSQRSVTFSQQREVMCSADIATTGAANRSSVDVVAVIDISGSMCCDLDLVKKTLEFMVDKFSSSDRFGLVTFGSEAKTELQLSTMSSQGKLYAHRVIQGLQVNGCTNLSAGLFLGIKEIATAQKRNPSKSPKSVLLFTDGYANEGITETEQLITATKAVLTPATTLHCFGYGISHNPTMLRSLSDSASGMYYFISNYQAITGAFADCLGGILSTVASSVRLWITVPRDFALKFVGSASNYTKISDLKYQLMFEGISSGESRNIPFQIKLPAMQEPVPNQIIATLSLNYIDPENHVHDEKLEITVSRGSPSEEGVQEQIKTSGGVKAAPTPEMMALDEHQNRIIVAQALEDASRESDRGNSPRAISILKQALDRTEVSMSSQTNFTQSLIFDLKETISQITGKPSHATKYMYSLARALYTQRSSGISSASLQNFVTDSKRSMVAEAAGEGTKVARSEAIPLAALKPPSKFSKKPAAKNNSVGTPAPVNNATVAPAPVNNPADAGAAASVNNPAGIPVGNLLGNFAPKVGPLDPSRMNVTPARKQKAIRRLMMDLQEIKRYPLRTVIAKPLEKDLFEWHCNVQAPETSPYAGITFHLVLQFPFSYPFHPPTLYFCSFIEHPHVFGSWVCLDLLQEGQWSSQVEMDKPYTGWTYAYTVHSILLQLQSFLFDEANNDPESIRKARESARKYTCPTTGHTMDNPFPVFPTDTEIEEAKKKYGISTVRAISKKPKYAGGNDRQPLVMEGHTKVELKHHSVWDQKLNLKVSPIQQKPQPRRQPKQQPVYEIPIIRKPASSAPSYRGEIPAPSTKPKPKPVNKYPPTPTNNAVPSALKITPTVTITTSTVSTTTASTTASTASASTTTTSTKSNNKPPKVIKTFTSFQVNDPKLQQIKNGTNGEDKLESTQASQKSQPVKAQQSRQKPQQNPQQKPQQKPQQNPQQKPQQKPQQSQVQQPQQVVQQVQQQQPEVQPEVQPTAQSTVQQVQQPEVQPEVQPTVQQPEVQSQQLEQPQVAPELQQSPAPLEIPQQNEQPQENQPPAPTVSHTISDDLKLSLENNPDATGISTSYFAFLSDEMIEYVFKFLSIDDLNELSEVCLEFQRISSEKSLWKSTFGQRYRSAYLNAHDKYLDIQNWKYVFKQEKAIAKLGLSCFHSKVSFMDDVMGIPILATQTTKFPDLATPLDLLSYEAFYEDNVRKSVWGQKFTHFLPVWINKDHGTRAWPYIKKAIAELTLKPDEKYRPELALEILPRLMNTMVVSVMNGTVHASIKALEGYCLFHRLLILFVKKYPELQEQINRKAERFCHDEEFRDKDEIPSLGEFLPLLSVATSISWDQISTAYLKENFDRHVLWTLKKFPKLARFNVRNVGKGRVDDERLKCTLDANLVSLKLVCFHVYFFRNVARPDNLNADEIADNYDRFYGRPSDEMKLNLQKKIFEIQKLNSWADFFRSINERLPSPDKLSQWLINSLENSARKGYHRRNQF